MYIASLLTFYECHFLKVYIPTILFQSAWNCETIAYYSVLLLNTFICTTNSQMIIGCNNLT